MKLMTLLAAMTIGMSSFVIVGCDEEVAHEKKVEVNGDTVKKTETTVTKEPDGDIRIDQKKDVNR
jgi:hypothetical protein